MTKGLMMFYTSLIILGVMTSKGCDKEATLSNEKKVELVDDLDEDLFQLLMKESDGSGLSYFTLPDDHNYDAIPQDPKNPINSFKVLLGKKLFCEPALAIKPKQSQGVKTYSCASCHIPAIGFTAGLKQGIGEGGTGYGENGEGRIPNASYIVDEIDVQPIRTPTVINGAYNRTSIWNGQFGAVGPNEGTESSWTAGKPTGKNILGFEGVETQAIAGLGVHRMDVDEEFIRSNYYKEWYDLAFPEIPESRRYTEVTTGLAIAAFERTVLAVEAPFQLWLKGDQSSMTSEQKKGALLFFGKANCNSCHDGPALNSEEFKALGMKDFEVGTDVIINNMVDFERSKKGRGGFTQREEDMFKFKTPQLYGLKQQGFYGHGGSFTTIKEVIEYKNKGVIENDSIPLSQVDPAFQPLGLSDEEVEQLADFVANALYDPDMSRYSPSGVASGMCFPNNDAQSKKDMNCGENP